MMIQVKWMYCMLKYMKLMEVEGKKFIHARVGKNELISKMKNA